MGMRRLLLGGISALLVAGSVTASAAAAPVLPHMPGSRAVVLPGNRVMALPGSRTLALPGFTAATASSTPRAALYFQTDPVPLQVGGVTYEMGLTAFKEIGQPATVDVVLSRGGASGSGQDYDYTLKPGGVGFTANLVTAGTAHLESGSAVAPSTIHLTYTADPGTAFTSRCTLTNGTKKSFVAYTSGKVSVSSMSLDTGSSFFGNVRVRPLTASLGYDPGCRSGGGSVSTLCLGPAELHTSAPAPATAWWAIDIHGTSRGLEEAFTQTSVSSALTLTQDAGAVSHIANTLPPPTFTATGAKAVFETTGDAFMRGMATFTSTAPPAISKPHTCSDWKDFSHHTYVLHVYRGILTPDDDSPLTAMFDTGAIPLIAQPAQLAKVVYTG